ncbi:MAG: hypothetical protein ACQKBW_02995 [Puniceicoccales bacterium]
MKIKLPQPLLTLAACALLGTAPICYGVDIYDDFERADSSSLGSTSGDLELPWTKITGGSTSDGTSAIYDDELLLTTTPTGKKAVVLLGATTGSDAFVAEDFTMTLQLQFSSEAAGDWFSVYYRAQNAASTSTGSDSYNLQIRGNGNLGLYDRGGEGQLGDTVSVDTGTTAHELTIVSSGSRQQIYWDDVLVLDVTDNITPWGAGAVKLWSFNGSGAETSSVSITSFELQTIPEPATMGWALMVLAALFVGRIRWRRSASSRGHV